MEGAKEIKTKDMHVDVFYEHQQVNDLNHPLVVNTEEENRIEHLTFINENLITANDSLTVKVLSRDDNNTDLVKQISHLELIKQ